MKYLKLPITAIVLISACFMMPNQAAAQWSIGASYEMRNEDPENGFGLRIERDILRPVPMVDIGLRAHFSYFSDEYSEGEVAGDLTYYDYGLAATGGVSLGLLKPYVGLGIGNGSYDFESDLENGNFDDSSFYWNGFVGTEVTIIPKLNPFIEYRFQQADEPEGIDLDSEGRLIIGATLSF